MGGMSVTPNPRDAILDAALDIAPFEGWTDTTLRLAVEATDLPEGAGALYFPDGALGLLRHWNARTVAHVEAEIAKRGLANLRIRDRVTEGIVIALEAIGPHEPAFRRALSRLALPDALGDAARMNWAVADAIWHGIGDTSTDFNFYTKRAILSGVLSASAVAWLNDTSPDKAQARAFIDRRIDNVMQFEKVKARVRGIRETVPNPAEFLGGLRFATSDMGSGLRRPNTKRRRRRSR